MTKIIGWECIGSQKHLNCFDPQVTNKFSSNCFSENKITRHYQVQRRLKLLRKGNDAENRHQDKSPATTVLQLVIDTAIQEHLIKEENEGLEKT